MEWLEEFKKEGYTIMIMPKKCRKTFYAAKNPKRTQSGALRSDSIWDQFKLLKDEKWGLPRGTFIEFD